jgi:hypothetical protein
VLAVRSQDAVDVRVLEADARRLDAGRLERLERGRELRIPPELVESQPAPRMRTILRRV